MNLFEDGIWKENVVDDSLPLQGEHVPIFLTPQLRYSDQKKLRDPNVFPRENYGWYFIQKLFCKKFQEYLYWTRPYFNQRIVSKYLQTLTGYPVKVI